MVSEIFVEGKRLDVTGVISSMITFAIDDIRDIGSRTTTFSKSIILPGTQNNNAIFGNIFDTGISNDYDPSQPNIGYNFNASKSANCIIFQDNLQTFKGTIRLLEIDTYKGQIEYQVALNGTLTMLSVAFISKLLTALDFSAYDQAYTVANISNSWSNTPGSGVYFPMADYGTYSTDKHNWQFGTFRPALYVKEYIDKMFAAANFRYQSDLFNTARFKRLIIPHNQKDVQAPKTGLMFTASRSAEYEVFNWFTGIVDADLIFTTFLGGLFTTTDNKTFTYNGASAISGILTYQVNGRYNYFLDVSGKCDIIIKKSGADYFLDPAPLIWINSSDQTYTRTQTIAISLNTGDTISVHYRGTTILGGFTKRVWTSAASMSFTSAATILAPVEYGETIHINYCLPQNIRQIDFFTSIVKLFNLYVYEDKFDERLILIKPFPNFYDQGTGSAIDWTYKLDRNSPIKVKPMSELNSKLYNFNFTEDSDYYNDLYKKRYNQVYGSYIFDTQFEFASNAAKIEIIFAPTPLVGYGGEEKVYPTIFKKSGTTEDRTDSVIRIMQTDLITGVVSWSIKNGATILGSYTSYGYAGHYDNPDNPGNDLNFGGLSEVFFKLSAGVLDNTQFNMFWSAYMAEITNKDAKLLTGKFYLTAQDIFNLDFAQFIVLDGVLFRLNKIIDYNASTPDECTVELLRALNVLYSFPPGSTVINDYALEWAPGDSMNWRHPGGIFFTPGDEEMLYK